MEMFEKHNITKEDSLEESTEKMKKKFKSMKDWIVLILGLGIFAIIMMLIIDIYTINSDESIETLKIQLVENDISVDSLIELEEKVFENDNDERAYVKKLLIQSTVVNTISNIINLIILFQLGELFKNIEKTGVPFSDETIKRLKRVNILYFILLLIGSGDIFTLVIISAIIFMIKYGCKVQSEVDEMV